jgi:hypothetical protein
MDLILSAIVFVAGLLVGAGIVAYRHYRRCRKAGMTRGVSIRLALTGGGGGPGPIDP